MRGELPGISFEASESRVFATDAFDMCSTKGEKSPMKLGLRLNLKLLAFGLAVLAAAVVAVGALGSAPSLAAAKPAVVVSESSWASAAIQSLVKSGVMVGYPDGKLRPQNPVTRAEFAKIAAKAFAIDPTRDSVSFPDVKDHPMRHWIAALAERKVIKGFPDGNFHPNDKISRAELAAMVSRLLRLPEGKGVFGPDRQPSYSDVTADTWAFSAVETAHQLGLAPPYIGANFRPEVLATRADAAYMVYAATQLQRTDGAITAIDSQYGTLTVRPDEKAGDTVARFFPVSEDALVMRNNSQSDLASLLKGDRVTILADADGKPRLVSSQGILTKNDLVNKVSAATDGLLSSADVTDAMSGNWRGVSDQLRLALYTRLLDSGMTGEEADSLLNRDWTTLEGLAKQRLADALSSEVHLSPDIVTAMLQRDWQKLGQFAQIDLVQQVLTGLLNR